MTEPDLNQATLAEAGADNLAATPERVRAVADALDDGRRDDLLGLVAPMHAADLADLIEALAPDDRRALVEMLGPDLDPQVLPELDENVRDTLIEHFDAKILAAAAAELETDDAAYVIEDLDEADRREVLDAMPADDRELLTEALAYPEDSAGRLMSREYVAVPSYWTVGQVIDWLRETDDVPDEFFQIIVVDPAHKPTGTVPLDRVLRSKRPVPIGAIVDSDLKLIPVTMDQAEIAFLFDQYGLTSAPVIDGGGRLVGQITVDDVVDVIQEEAEADLHQMGGVAAEGDLHLPAMSTARKRFLWLIVNLVTAILASVTIGLFADTIEQVVALAVLMPIVASMGGNAGIQTLTVAVRALATRELTAANAARIVWKETVVGGINGIAFAGLVGIVAAVWFWSPMLGVVIALAMIVNMFAAGLSGILIPLALERFKIDPAISATVFLTTVTDVVGFFVFLGLGKLILL